RPAEAAGAHPHSAASARGPGVTAHSLLWRRAAMTGINVGHSIHDYSDVAVDPSGVNEPSQQTRDAILVVDVDHFTARALLFDMVEGAPRFVAVGVSHSTAAPPVGDPTVGVAEAIRDLELQTGRTLVDG